MITNKVAGLGKLASWTSRKSLLNGLKVNRLSGCYPTKNDEPVENAEVKSEVQPVKTTFSKAFDKYTGQESFAKLFRNSAFVRMGDPKGKVVEGVIHHIVDDDLYVDFGAKFDCVCLRPLKNGTAYKLGTKVRVVLHDPELSTRFLGATTDLTILEADGFLIGLLNEMKTEPPGKSISEEILSSSS